MSKFIQISSNSRSEGIDILYALDDNGYVWKYDQSGHGGAAAPGWYLLESRRYDNLESKND